MRIEKELVDKVFYTTLGEDRDKITLEYLCTLKGINEEYHVFIHKYNDKGSIKESLVQYAVSSYRNYVVLRTKWDDIPKDACVVVWDDDTSTQCYKGHFAGIRNGKPTIWTDSKTSYTVDTMDDRIEFSDCQYYNEFILNKGFKSY